MNGTKTSDDDRDVKSLIGRLEAERWCKHGTGHIPCAYQRINQCDAYHPAICAEAADALRAQAREIERLRAIEERAKEAFGQAVFDKSLAASSSCKFVLTGEW